MTDRLLLNAIRALLGLLLAICVLGLFTAASLYEAFWLSALIASVVFGLRALREF